MPVNLSIKNVPDELAHLLRERAESRHRSLQGELMAILEEAVLPQRGLSPAELLERVRSLGLTTRGEAAGWIREDRDGR
jgi:antitoxin FitA